MTGISEPGFFGTLAATEGVADVTQTGATTGGGHADLYYSVTGGSPQWKYWDTDFFTPIKVGPYNPADLRLHVTDTPVAQSGEFDWITSSNDPLTGYYVPEPLTMLGVFLAVGSITGYLRRRKLT